MRDRDVTYSPGDRLAVHVILYLTPSAVLVHDVDNRLNDVLDALQGRAGGSQNVHFSMRIIPNHSQIVRVSIEKSARRDARRFGDRIIVRKLHLRGTRRGSIA